MKGGRALRLGRVDAAGRDGVGYLVWWEFLGRGPANTLKAFKSLDLLLTATYTPLHLV